MTMFVGSLNVRFCRGVSRGVRCAAAASTTPLTQTPRVARNVVPRETRKDADASADTAPFLHIIPESKWKDGIPAVQGGHVMASGSVSPLSTSKGVLSSTSHILEYPEGPGTCALVQYPGEETAAEGLAEMVLNSAREAIQSKGSFSLVLSGGSLVKLLGRLAERDAEWDKWHVFWVDERVVAHDDPDSNYKGAMEAFLAKVPIPSMNVHPIAENVNAAEAAVHYEGVLIEHVSRKVLPKSDSGFPVFDLVLLGVGPDGHVASLFPNKAQTAAKQGWVLAVEDSPKPPPQRITLSMPVINAANQVAIVALGDGKAEIVQRVLEVQSLPGALPAQMVRPESSDLTWILDGGSSKLLKVHHWDNKQSFPRNAA